MPSRDVPHGAAASPWPDELTRGTAKSRKAGTSFHSKTGPIGPTGPSERGKTLTVGRSRYVVGRFARAVGQTEECRSGTRAPERVDPLTASRRIALPNVSLESPLTWSPVNPRA